tara:strand:+ start:247 stop:483 length:237 start_codon:yes stop_codon:yes gene_type:complete
MEFYDIKDDLKVFPGEYLLYRPQQRIVLCGAYLKSQKKIKALSEGRMIIDKVENFQKIKLTSQEHKNRAASRCKGCEK